MKGEYYFIIKLKKYSHVQKEV